MKIMLVDDNKAFLDSTKDVLEDKGYTVVTAESGVEAVELLRKQDFDVVIMDIKMPGMNGVESFIEMKKIKPGIAVIMVTAYSIDSLIQKAFDEGACTVMKKPLNMSALFTAIDNLRTRGNGGLILIADDDKELCDNLENILGTQGYTVISAYDGKEAVEKAQRHPVDILLIDMKIPTLNGFEIFHTVRKIKPKIVAIIITAYAQEMDALIQKMLKDNACACLAKPLDIGKLMGVLKSECVIRHQLKENAP